jgi:energy-coupling factor transporter ATP-binding protein EcfA2
MIDWLVVWGATQAAGLVVKPILEEFTKETVKDFAKDFFKEPLKKVIHWPESDVLKEAYGKALKEFLQLMEQELTNANCREEQIREYINPLKQFVLREDVAAALGQAFELECKSIDTRILNQTWQDLTAPSLPDDFDWELVSKLYVRAIKKIINESEKLRSIHSVQAQINTAAGIKDLAGIAPEFNLRTYAEGLQEQYGTVKLESLDTTGVYYSDLKLWKIFISQNVRECQEFLPQVYELPKEHGRRLRDKGQLDEAEIAEAELERRHQAYRSQVNRSILEIVTGNSPAQKVVILGDPGAGKSSLLQYLALIWAEQPTRDLALQPTPLLIELRTYARDRQAGTCKDILTFLHGGNITCRLDQQQLHDKLKAGQAIALFDGIDEVFDPALRDEVVTDIHRFTNDYPQVRVIVTSRWLSYKVQRLRDAGFQHFMLQDLEDDQIEDFIQRWHDLTFPVSADKERKQERLQKALRESKSIRELAGNPLLLTMMAILNRHQELPRDRPRLYERASEVLLHQWDVERLLEDPQLKDWKISLDYKDKQGMLRKVAHHMQSSEKGLAGNIISATDLENILTEYLRGIIEKGEPRMVARRMIDQLRTRNFILCYLGADSYAFVHRTFLEYFCAWEFVWQFKETQTLTVERLKNEVFAPHWQDESWHEVLRLISGMIDAKFVADMIDYLLSQQVDKSMYSQRETLVQQKTRGRKTALNKTRRQKLKKQNEEWIEMSNLFLAVSCFAEVRNKQLINPTSIQLIRKMQYEIEKDNFSSIGSEVVVKIISLLASVGHDNSATLLYLKDYLNTSRSVVRRAIIQSISQGWQYDPDTLQMLRYYAENDKDLSIRLMSSTILIENFQEKIDISDVLKYHENNDTLGAHIATIKDSSQAQKNRDKTFYFPYKTAQDSSREKNQRIAIVDAICEDKKSTEWWIDEVFAPHWQDEYWHETLLLISSLIDKEVVVEIINYLLAQQVDRSVFLQKETFLERRTKGRKTALNKTRRQVLIKRNEEWIDMSNLFLAVNCFAEIKSNQIIEAISTRLMRRIQREIEKDNSCSIGTEMANALIFLLATIWKDNHETLPYLKKCLNTGSLVIQRAAIQSISQIWRDDPDTLNFLSYHAKNHSDSSIRSMSSIILIENFQDGIDNVDILNHHQYDDDLNIRLTVCEDSTQTQKNRLKIAEFLYDLAQDNSSEVNHRQAALKAIVENYSDQPEVIDLLVDRSQNDPDEQVRKFAKEQLVIWRSRSITVSEL